MNDTVLYFLLPDRPARLNLWDKSAIKKGTLAVVGMGTANMRISTGLAFVVLVPLTGPALGAAVCSDVAPQCVCTLPAASFTPVGAHLSGVQGAVQVTAVNPGTDPTAPRLTIGDTALVLAGGAATLNFGTTCSAALAPQSSLVIRDIDGCACASVVDARTTASIMEGGSGAPEPVEDVTGPGIQGSGGGFGGGAPGGGGAGGSGGGMGLGGLAGLAGLGGIAGLVAWQVTQDDDGAPDSPEGPPVQ